MWTRDFSGGCAWTPNTHTPFNIVDFLSPGMNHITVKLIDKCGRVGNSQIYVVGNITPPPPASKPPGYICGTAKFFGTRGSGEQNFEGNGMGKTLNAMWQKVHGIVPGIRFEYTDYPAIPVNVLGRTYANDYVDSVSKGASKLETSLKNFIAWCPKNYAMLAGYSQGAEVVNTVIARLNAVERRHIASVTLFGDPSFNPQQPGIDQGTFDRSFYGINVSVYHDHAVQWPSDLASRAKSYCLYGDVICDFSPAFIGPCAVKPMSKSCPHLFYKDLGWTTTAGQWAAKNWRRMPAL
jgi:hypothetical protein